MVRFRKNNNKCLAMEQRLKGCLGWRELNDISVWGYRKLNSIKYKVKYKFVEAKKILVWKKIKKLNGLGRS